MTEKPLIYIPIDNVYVIMHTENKTKYLVLATEIFDHWIESLPPKARTMVLAMLEHSFVHLPSIGAQTEERLWSLGCRTWDDLEAQLPELFGRRMPALVWLTILSWAD